MGEYSDYDELILNDELVIEDNTIYEMDLDCFECLRKERQRRMKDD
ncbi:hypothetical protein [Anaeromicropila populeti]|uniref:Uncharacterized protein n=1 Tax=Anaeromicropila populeti TaxID=37658 RepID=A0A1I6JMY3_9FIRM|nr:hypothetical protein [Anaeromicropila populeti]SFR80335.1 hypothetical protein SAMN05661086_01786 [Anaeromicropila populeti]